MPRVTEALAGILSVLVPRARIVPAVPAEFLSKDPQVVRSPGFSSPLETPRG